MLKSSDKSEQDQLTQKHWQRLDWLEHSQGAVVTLSSEYPDGYEVPLHHHSRSQLLHALTGVVMVATVHGRWLVPPDHAMWIPAGVEHAVDMLGKVRMRSVYVAPDALPSSVKDLRVVAISDLARSLIIEASHPQAEYDDPERWSLVARLLLSEIPRLPVLPLALPFPAEPRLAALCRAFIREPTPHTDIDEWAERLGMSRRSFTRAFHRETGLSLSMWRQQACLLAALPRLADGQSVTQVALDLGYDSVPAFTTMFRRMSGETPSRYLQRATA